MYTYNRIDTPSGVTLECYYLDSIEPIPARFRLGNEAEVEQLAQALLDLAFALDQRADKHEGENPFGWLQWDKTFQVNVLHNGQNTSLSEIDSTWTPQTAYRAYQLGISLLAMATSMRKQRAYVAALKAG